MDKRRKVSIDFFEGILVGIYGNWLISLMENINFAEVQLYHFILLLISFTAFVAYFLYMLIAEHKLTELRIMVLLVFVHYFLWIFVYFDLEGHTYQSVLFSSVGALFFLALFIAEMYRNRNIDLT